MIPVDRERLRSVQGMHGENCRVGVAHCAKRCLADARNWLFWRSKREFKKSGGGATGRSPQGRATASGKRRLLAEVFAQALMERDADATTEQIENAREKAIRAPFLTLAIARLGPCEPDIEPLELMVSLGAAIQNFLLCAHSLGFGSSLTSGQAMRSLPLRQLFQVSEGEQAVCCNNVGTVAKRKTVRLRPETTSFVSSL